MAGEPLGGEPLAEVARAGIEPATRGFSGDPPEGEIADEAELPMDREIREDQIRPPKEAGARLLPALDPVSVRSLVTVETLRAKLDAAIVAEAWDAVPVIRERIAEAEREVEEADAKAATVGGNVVPFPSKKGG
jgi:hypothetical protein